MDARLTQLDHVRRRMKEARSWMPWALALGGLALWLPGASESDASHLPSLPRVLGAVGVIGGVLWGLPSLLVGVRGATQGKKGRIQVLEVRPMGRRRRLMLLKVEGKTLLIGDSESGWTRLESWDAAPERAFSRRLADTLCEAEA